MCRAAVISFHTILTIVGGKRIPTSVVAAIVVSGWALTSILSTRSSPLLWIELMTCSTHWPSCDREGCAGTVLWCRWRVVFRNVAI
jgi:hypothetical protein